MCYFSPWVVDCRLRRELRRAGALGRPRGMGWGERWEGGSRWGMHVNPWLIHVNVWQKPLQYYKVISLQPIKINEKKKELRRKNTGHQHNRVFPAQEVTHSNYFPKEYRQGRGLF